MKKSNSGELARIGLYTKTMQLNDHAISGFSALKHRLLNSYSINSEPHQKSKPAIQWRAYIFY